MCLSSLLLKETITPLNPLCWRTVRQTRLQPGGNIISLPKALKLCAPLTPTAGIHPTNPAITPLKFFHRYSSTHSTIINSRKSRLFKMAPVKEFGLLCLENPLLGKLGFCLQLLICYKLQVNLSILLITANTGLRRHSGGWKRRSAQQVWPQAK
jgi:hypothetical protein